MDNYYKISINSISNLIHDRPLIGYFIMGKTN
jgi:hypothetical protein